MGLALATVLETWGSSPCPPGSQMVVNSQTGFGGSVSGGCIESSVVSECLEIIRDGGTQVLQYGVSDEQGASAGLACGGTVKVFVEPLDAVLLAQLQAPPTFVRIVNLHAGTWAIVADGKSTGALSVDDELMEVAERVTVTQQCEVQGGAYFFQPVLPAYRMFVIGAVRIAQTLAPMAAEAGFHVTVIDPRKAFATDQRFPGVNVMVDWPDAALQDQGLDHHSAVVTLTHDAKPDDMALALALRSKAFYIGALGSRKTHAARVERLHELGLTQRDIDRIHAPIGLNIGGRSPAEIAVSILAQVIAAKNNKLGDVG